MESKDWFRLLIGYVEQLSNYHSRQSKSIGAQQAERFLVEYYTRHGFETSTFTFRSDYSDNVIAERKGILFPDEIIIVGAHYDSRATDTNSPTQRAPGADDNGSGTSNLMELARIIFLGNVQFSRTIRLVSFSGEEQGLFGSRAYAMYLAENNENVVAMFNGDMLGYYPDDDYPITLGMKDKFIDPNLLKAANEITELYVPDLGVGISNSCCSDHQSFTEAGFSAIGYFEHEGSASNYPYYHTSFDLPKEINVKQLHLESKAIMAAAFTYAQVFRNKNN